MTTDNIRGGYGPWEFDPQQRERLAALDAAQTLLGSTTTGYELVAVAAFVLAGEEALLPPADPTPLPNADAEQRLGELRATYGWDRIEKALGLPAARLIHG